jgi:rRNA maturation endonuclease Nob1
MNCPKCGSEMKRRTVKVMVESDELSWEEEIMLCPGCGHEEKVEAEKSG